MTSAIVEWDNARPVAGSFARTADPLNLIGFCPRCSKSFSIFFDERGGGHRLTSRDPLSIQGSIVCPNGCRAHYFVTNGEIAMAGDA